MGRPTVSFRPFAMISRLSSSVLIAEGDREDFLRSGMSDYQTFLIEDLFGATFFHLLLGPIIAALLAQDGRRVVKISPANSTPRGVVMQVSMQRFARSAANPGFSGVFCYASCYAGFYAGCLWHACITKSRLDARGPAPIIRVFTLGGRCRSCLHLGRLDGSM